jgi:Tfp pilus assembly protein PilX
LKFIAMSRPDLLQRRTRRNRNARGIVLIVALVLLLVISMGSTVGVRLAMNSSAIATGLKGATEAQQLADLGLRWCELQARLAAAGQPAAGIANLNIPPADTVREDAWENFATFDATARPISGQVLAAAGMPAATPPQCMVIESKTWPGVFEDDKNMSGVMSSKGVSAVRKYQITVRGMSRDFIENTNGEDRGSEVWLQSTLILNQR